MKANQNNNKKLECSLTGCGQGTSKVSLHKLPPINRSAAHAQEMDSDFTVPLRILWLHYMIKINTAH